MTKQTSQLSQMKQFNETRYTGHSDGRGDYHRAGVHGNQRSTTQPTEKRESSLNGVSCGPTGWQDAVLQDIET